MLLDHSGMFQNQQSSMFHGIGRAEPVETRSNSSTNVLAARLRSGNAVQHLDELARPIRFVNGELGKQLDVGQQFGCLVLPCGVGLCLRVNVCIRTDSNFSRIVATN
jgi:hypothetical protein